MLRCAEWSTVTLSPSDPQSCCHRVIHSHVDAELSTVTLTLVFFLLFKTKELPLMYAKQKLLFCKHTVYCINTWCFTSAPCCCNYSNYSWFLSSNRMSFISSKLPTVFLTKSKTPHTMNWCIFYWFSKMSHNNPFRDVWLVLTKKTVLILQG